MSIDCRQQMNAMAAASAADAMELGPLLQFPNDWLATGRGPVNDSLTRYVGCETGV